MKELLAVTASYSGYYRMSTAPFDIGDFIIELVLFLIIAEIIYIFIEAPKCGMSRLWAIVPLFSNLFGLIVFIIVRSNRKTGNNSPAQVVTCPTCGGVHPLGTMECSICGTKLQ